MRIRSTKPEFWRSNTIAELSWEDRFVLKGIEAYVDDNGVGKDDIELIATEVFPRDTFRNPRDTLARLSASISRIHAAGLIARYVANDEKLVYVDKWADIQRIDRPGKGRFPRPDGTMEYSQPVNRESYKNPRDTLASPRDTLATGTGEQGNRGTGEKEPPYPPDDEPSPSRAPARRTGSDAVRDRIANLPARSVTAYRVAETFSASLAVPIESGLLSKIGVQIDNCLKRGIPPPAIAAGLKAWTDSDSWSPSQIPNFVHKANNRSRSTNGKPTEKALGHDAALAELLQEVQTL